MEIAIKPAVFRDIGDALALDKQAFGPDAWSLPDFVMLFAETGTYRFTARADGKFAGFAAVTYDDKENEVWLATLAVPEEFRHRGIGSRLLEVCDACRPEVPHWLQVSAENPDAQKLYRDHGYVIAGREPAYYFSGADALIMVKNEKTL